MLIGCQGRDIDAAALRRYDSPMWAPRAGWFWIATFWLATTTATAARAAEIDWRAPEHCPDADELRFRIERVIAMPLRHAAPLRFTIRAEPSAQGFTAHIEIAAGQTSTGRERVLSARACNELADMVTVAVALALGADPSAIEGGAPPPPARTETDLAASADRSTVQAAAGAAVTETLRVRDGEEIAVDRVERAPVDARGSDGWRPGLSLWLLADSGSLPAPGLGAALGVQLERARFQLRALGTVLFDQHESLAVAADQSPGADLALWTGSLSACAIPLGASGAPFAAQACAGWELGRLSGDGTGVQQPRAGAALWSAPRADWGASWALGGSPWRLGALLTLVLPLTRENFVLSELGSVHRPPSAVGRVAIGLEWVPR
jgi:hypothetical protein